MFHGYFPTKKRRNIWNLVQFGAPEDQAKQKGLGSRRQWDIMRPEQGCKSADNFKGADEGIMTRVTFIVQGGGAGGAPATRISESGINFCITSLSSPNQHASQSDWSSSQYLSKCLIAAFRTVVWPGSGPSFLRCTPWKLQFRKTEE
ncbi:hypothetical protein PM082_015655 [Marasmius tenuissimus]|nr:hypothetical protein PM082_015655 [Marasmius tenuissimus]